MIPASVLEAYGFGGSVRLESYGSGHIHRTYRVFASDRPYILQRINHHVFTKPARIMRNIRLAGQYLSKHHPDYFFLSVCAARNSQEMVYDAEGYPWRLFPFIENTTTINEISSPSEAFEAAKGFAQLTRNLSGCNVQEYEETIERFHDLRWRFEQFESACKVATADRMRIASETVETCRRFSYLVDEYTGLIGSGSLQLRITHNDTKINNILFDQQTGKAVCVIDLDTLMPGYFIYDLGDMIRSGISPTREDEADLSMMVFRKEIYDALVQGYCSVLNDELTASEKAAIPFSGLMMTYIMGLRFMADYLNGDVYYATSYPGQNLARARNQMHLLGILAENRK